MLFCCLMQENKGVNYAEKGKRYARITTKINRVQFNYTEASGHKVGYVIINCHY